MAKTLKDLLSEEVYDDLFKGEIPYESFLNIINVSRDVFSMLVDICVDDSDHELEITTCDKATDFMYYTKCVSDNCSDVARCKIIYTNNHHEVKSELIDRHSNIYDSVLDSSAINEAKEIILVIDYVDCTRSNGRVIKFIYFNADHICGNKGTDKECKSASEIESKIYSGLQNVISAHGLFNKLDQKKLSDSVAYIVNEIIKFVDTHKNEVKDVKYNRIDMQHMCAVPADVIASVNNIKDKERIIYVGPLGESNDTIIDNFLKNGYMPKKYSVYPIVYMYLDNESGILSIFIITYESLINEEFVKTEKEVLNSKPASITEDISNVKDMNTDYVVEDMIYAKMKAITDNIERCKDFEQGELKASITEVSEYITKQVKDETLKEVIAVPVRIHPTDDIKAVIVDTYGVEKNKVMYAGSLGIVKGADSRAEKIAETILGFSCIPVNYPNVYYTVLETGLLCVYITYSKKGDLEDE